MIDPMGKRSLMARVVLRSVTIGFLFAFCLGFLWSDNELLDNLIVSYNLRSPSDAFTFLLDHKKPANVNTPIVSHLSIVELYVDKDGLYCDEGAIVLAAINHRMGYDTRLVDLIDIDGVSKHTVCQVYIGSAWITYDFTNRKSTIDPKSLVDYQASLRVRTYPNVTHKILMSNYFMRKLRRYVK